jgi:hypothetical protein
MGRHSPTFFEKNSASTLELRLAMRYEEHENVIIEMNLIKRFVSGNSILYCLVLLRAAP